MRTSRKYALVIGLLLLTLLLGAAGVYFANRQAPGTGDETSDAGQNKPPGSSLQSTPAQPPKTYDVKIYFSKHPESDDDPSATFPVHRTATDLGIASFAVSQLLKGPTRKEIDNGFFSTVQLKPADSTCNGKAFTLTIKDSLAVLRFCKPFNHLGVVADGQAESSLNATLGQFNSVKTIRILNTRGDCEFDLSGENRCLQ